MPLATRQGNLAETAFLYRGTELGFRISQPYGNCERYDFIVDNGRKRWRVQVKSTRVLCGKNRYRVNVGHRPIAEVNRPITSVAYLQSEIDFLAVYILPERTWYIVPIAGLAGRVRLSFFAGEDAKAGPNGVFHEAWHLLAGRKTESVPAADRIRRTIRRRRGKQIPRAD